MTDEPVDLEDLGIRAPKPVTLSDILMRSGLARDPREVVIVMAVSVSVLIALSVYLLASAVPPQP